MTTAETKDCAHVCTTEVPPANWVGNLIPAARRYDATADKHGLKHYSDDLFWRISPDDNFWQHGERHSGQYTGRAHLWLLHLRQKIGQHIWHTNVCAITDDFGWLVEVPTC